MSDDGLRIAEYDPLAAVALTDAERWPGLTPADRSRLVAIVTHPDAPAWTHRTGHRLEADAIARLTRPRPTGDWLADHLSVVAGLPAYRHFGRLDRLTDFPLVTRDDLLDDIGGFVPLDADLSRMVQGSSSGTTGRALQIPDDIDDIARTFWLMHELVASLGIDWTPDPDRLGLAYVVHQRQAFTYTSLIPGFTSPDGGASAMARLNLDPTVWPDDRRLAFLSDTDPQVYCGSPASLAALLDPRVIEAVHPLALFSGAVHLSGPLRADLESAFGCPVLDLYGLHETRPIAVSTDGGPFVLLNRRVHVEIIDESGEAVAPGTRGEIVVTAGENPLLPLARYRTGDFGRIVEVNGKPAIDGLEGREDVIFRTPAGQDVPAVDLTQQLQAHGARGWSVHQRGDGSVTATVVGGDAEAIAAKLGALLSTTVSMTQVATIAELGEGKPRRYRSEPGAASR